jgi:hypothetical protein
MSFLLSLDSLVDGPHTVFSTIFLCIELLNMLSYTRQVFLRGDAVSLYARDGEVIDFRRN